MLKIITKLFVTTALALSLWACAPTMEGGEGDRLAARVAAELGLDPDDFYRASKEEIDDRLKHHWKGLNGTLEFGTFTIDGEENTYLRNRGRGRVGDYTTQADVAFTIYETGDNGLVRIRFHKGEICVNELKNRCSRSRAGNGTVTMYLSDEMPNAIGLFIDYKIRGTETDLDSSSYFTGDSNWDFGGVLQR